MKYNFSHVDLHTRILLQFYVRIKHGYNFELFRLHFHQNITALKNGINSLSQI